MKARNTLKVPATNLVWCDGRRDHSEVNDIRVKVKCALCKGVWKARIVLQLFDECLDVILSALEIKWEVVWGVEAEGRPAGLKD